MFAFLIIALIVVLFICLVASRSSAAELQRTVNTLRFFAKENEARLDYYRGELHRKEEHRRISTENITRMAVEHHAELERDARECRLKNARDAADAIRARIGGHS
jgi:hypothetical protein